MASTMIIDYYKILNTVVEMLIDRGYESTDLNEKYYNMDLDDLQEMIKDGSLQIQVKHKTDKKIGIVHFFNFNLKLKGEGKMKKDDIMQIINHQKNNMEKGYEYDILIVTKDKPNSQILNRIGEINSPGNTDPIEKMLFVESFIHDELKYNVSRHTKVPQHSKTPLDEIDLILKKYNVILKDLPKISSSDPQCRYLGLRSGDVCKVERISPTTGKYIYYRLVI